MGINGLHPVIKPYLRPIQLSKFHGQRVGCDAFAWLHRGACGCATELATGHRWWEERNMPPPYVEFCLRMLAMLKSNGVVPVVVFDGGSLPAKAGTQDARRARKREVLAKAHALLAEGNKQAADSLFCQTVDVTADMAHELVLRLRKESIEFLVAPYEADSQLAFLTRKEACAGGIAAVITEDSDLVAYGCPNVIFKCQKGGMALELCLADLFAGRAYDGADGPAAVDPEGGKAAVPLSFRHFTLDMLQSVCVLAGCDFQASVKGIGFKKAHGLIKKHRTLPRVLSVFRCDKKFSAMERSYPEAAMRALNNFRHALVFDASAAGGSLTRLTPLPAELKGGDVDLDYLGPVISTEIACGIAYGRLQPRAPYHRFHAAPQPAPAGQAVLAGGASWLSSAICKDPSAMAGLRGKQAAGKAPVQTAGIAAFLQSGLQQQSRAQQAQQHATPAQHDTPPSSSQPDYGSARVTWPVMTASTGTAAPEPA
ncbi:hypothetical protein WJX72_005315 [[Myrmecia] bisecta]|uniref:Exonuclease 1 n=1 Tax=[Myrmecia] bisecta TaxID=41462 RepID=A0AAW1PXV2_9CHLO